MELWNFFFVMLIFCKQIQILRVPTLKNQTFSSFGGYDDDQFFIIPTHLTNLDEQRNMYRILKKKSSLNILTPCKIL